MFAKNAMLCAFACLFVGNVTAATFTASEPKHDKKKDEEKKPAVTARDHAGQIGAVPKHKDHKKTDDGKLTVGGIASPRLGNLYAVSTPLKPASYRGNVRRNDGYSTHCHSHRHLLS